MTDKELAKKMADKKKNAMVRLLKEFCSPLSRYELVEYSSYGMMGRGCCGIRLASGESFRSPQSFFADLVEWFFERSSDQERFPDRGYNGENKKEFLISLIRDHQFDSLGRDGVRVFWRRLEWTAELQDYFENGGEDPPEPEFAYDDGSNGARKDE